MLGGEDYAVVTDSQAPVVAASQWGHLSCERCGVLGKLLNLGDDPLSILCGEAAHISDRPCPPFDLRPRHVQPLFSQLENRPSRWAARRVAMVVSPITVATPVQGQGQRGARQARGLPSSAGAVGRHATGRTPASVGSTGSVARQAGHSGGGAEGCCRRGPGPATNGPFWHPGARQSASTRHSYVRTPSPETLGKLAQL